MKAAVILFALAGIASAQVLTLSGPKTLPLSQNGTLTLSLTTQGRDIGTLFYTLMFSIVGHAGLADPRTPISGKFAGCSKVKGQCSLMSNTPNMRLPNGVVLTQDFGYNGYGQPGLLKITLSDCLAASTAGVAAPLKCGAGIVVMVTK